MIEKLIGPLGFIAIIVISLIIYAVQWKIGEYLAHTLF